MNMKCSANIREYIDFTKSMQNLLKDEIDYTEGEMYFALSNPLHLEQDSLIELVEGPKKRLDMLHDRLSKCDSVLADMEQELKEENVIEW